MSNTVEKNTDQNVANSSSLSRRELLYMAAGATASAALTSGVAIAGKEHAGHAAHAKNEHQGLIDSALDCVKTGQLCLDHCMELFKQGDTSVADCADSVNELLAMCTALSQMVAYQSRHLKAFATVCVEVCKDCEKECRKHEEHAQCKDCAESCASCIKELEKIIA